jgi:hypothetical protein
MPTFSNSHVPDSPKGIEDLDPFVEKPYSTEEVFLEWAQNGLLHEAVQLIQGPTESEPLGVVDLPSRQMDDDVNPDPTEG